jgi:hypothetical protein
MSKIKPIIVTIKETRRKKQPWSFTIDRPGPKQKETKAEWYVTAWSAKRGAKRMLGAIHSLSGGHYYVFDNKARKERHIEFVVVPLKKARKKAK